MNTVSRGIRNAFRNVIRTFSIVVILGLIIGLSLSMLVAHQAVGDKIKSVESSIGNTVSISPAGFSGFSSVNNSLTTSELSKVSTLPHVTNVQESLTDRLTTIGSSTQSFFSSQSTSTSSQTSLTSPVNINTGGGGPGGGHFFISGGGSLPTNFTPPISITGTNDTTSLGGTPLTLISGQVLNGMSNANNAMVSKSMANKNNLKVGSTFTAYSTTMTVTGIFTVSSNESAAGTVVVSLPTEQRLSGQSGDITSAVATVDSLSNLASVTSAIKKTLGSSTADVTSSVTQANNTVAPLNSVKTVSLYSLIGAVVAGGIIILLTMVMIVRERRREIGVVKAIGASNINIMIQFMTEAVTLTLLASIIGILIGFVAGNPITKLLVNNSSSTSNSSSFSSGGRGGGGFSGSTPHRVFGGIRSDFSSIHTAVGWNIIIYGILAALVIAIVGSAVASFIIAKIRPAEVMRIE
ncbi:MAG TPA: FtsX-like permease family protein [Candidatus Saccharimonadia bacterium]|nr:FtsX-like permease family protein [Candidatus Saccharimonadia bacterium]